MFKIDEIKELIRLIDESSTISELEIEDDGTKIAIKKNARPTIQSSNENATISTPIHPYYQPIIHAPAPQAQPLSIQPAPQQELPQVKKMEATDGALDSSLVKITSPMVGTFYKSPSPDSPAFIKLGDKVKSGTTVCIVEAMKLMNEIESEVNGTVIEILVENGQLVEYGQPLFLVKAD